MGDVYVSADYCTLTKLKRYIEINGGTVTDDDVLIDIIREGSDTITDACNRSFVPSVDTKLFTVPRTSSVLELPSDLLSITSITVGDTSPITLTANTDYKTLPLMPVYNAIRYINGVWSWGDEVTIEGVWGWNNNPSGMWRSIGTITEALDATETAIDVSTLDAIGVLSYVKVDNEVMQVTATDAHPHAEITVIRGELGSTAATHLTGATLYRYIQYPSLEQAAILRCAYLYRTRPNPSGQRIEGSQGSFTISEQELRTVTHTIRKLRRMVQEGQAS